MNVRQLVVAALAGKPVPRCPAGPLAVHYCARLSGLTIRQYTLDAQALADSVVRYYRRFRPDVVWLSADTWVNAEAMGARVGFVDENQPLGGLGPPRIGSAADLDGIPPPDPTRFGRWPLMLEALRSVRAALGEDVFLVACFDQYPFSLAGQLLGINRMMTAVLEERPLAEALMERCLEYALAYAAALAEAGADMLSGGDSPAGLIGPRLYREVAQPFERRLITGIRERTPIPISLHICGDCSRILRDMADTGADVLEIDYPVAIGRAAETVGPDIALWGNLDPVGLLALADPPTVYRRTQELLEQVRASGVKRFVVSSGCTLAVETPPENLDAFFAAAREFGPWTQNA
ncbi:MAG: uroporphyrinogen decarboxylase family protein [Thermogutta sp.]